MLNKKGMTLVELTVVIALIAVILLPISSFLISNYKIFNKAEKQVDAQSSAQAAMNLLINRAMEAKGMKVTEQSPDIAFEFDLGESKKWIFKYDSAQKTIFSNDKSNSTELRACAWNIQAINVIEINSGEGVSLVLQSRVGDQSVNITNEVNFRNH